MTGNEGMKGTGEFFPDTREDYFWVKDFKEKDVSSLGFNRCWACKDDDDRGNITLGYPQVNEALDRSTIANREIDLGFRLVKSLVKQ